MTSSSRSYDYLWLSIALLILVSLSFLFSIHGHDYWWLVRIGKETLLNGSVPRIEELSWSQAGKPIHYQPWLAGVMFWLTYDLGGATATYLLRAVLLASTFGIYWFMARQVSNPWVATILVLIAGVASANNWQIRSQLFAYPLFALSIYSLLHWHKGNKRWLWVLPLITVLWSNLHGSFALALVAAGSALIFGRGDRKSLALILGLMIVGTCINPRGVDTWRYLDFMLTSPSDQLFSVEWFPPTNTGWQMNIFFAWVLVLVPLVAFSANKPSMLECIWFVGFGWLAFSGIRYMVWLLLVLIPLTASLIHGLPWRTSETNRNVPAPLFNYFLISIFACLPLLYLPGVREAWWADAPPAYAPESNPFEAVEWLAAHPELPGPLWNDYVFGSYLAFAMPSRPTWLDPRFFVFPPDQMETYQTIDHASDEWNALLDAEGVNLLFLSVKAQKELVALVQSSPIWCEQYRDDDAVIFARCEPIQ